MILRKKIVFGLMLIGGSVSAHTAAIDSKTNSVVVENKNEIISDSLTISLNTNHNYDMELYKFDVKPRPWLAAAEEVGMNLVFHLLTRYVADEDYARIGWKSIKNNFETGFLWDNDKFETNLFSHPYQGGLYYNAARSNGMNFWQSAPFTLMGSAIWELFMETQPPSTNDIIATTFGGIALGEMTHRLSSLILNEQATGSERVFRELAAAIINPVRGVNRLARGESWRIGPRYVDETANVPFHFQFGAGYRVLKDNDTNSKSKHIGNIDLAMIYNDPFEIDGRVPFQYFHARFSFNLFSRQPSLGTAKLCASIWGKATDYKIGSELFWGIFQNFNYYNSESLNRSHDDIPFRIAETVSYGPGAIFRLPLHNINSVALVSGYASGIVLGGSYSDNFDFQDRDYNMGSGYSLRLDAMLEWKGKVGVAVNFENYRIYTWKGYENKDYRNIDPNYLNVQGAKGNAKLQIFRVGFLYKITKDFGVNGELTWYKRNSNYKYFKDVLSREFESRIMLTYQI